jgi:hypothetical protein
MDRKTKAARLSRLPCVADAIVQGFLTLAPAQRLLSPESYAIRTVARSSLASIFHQQFECDLPLRAVATLLTANKHKPLIWPPEFSSALSAEGW